MKAQVGMKVKAYLKVAGILIQSTNGMERLSR